MIAEVAETLSTLRFGTSMVLGRGSGREILLPLGPFSGQLPFQRIDASGNIRMHVDTLHLFICKEPDLVSTWQLQEIVRQGSSVC